MSIRRTRFKALFLDEAVRADLAGMPRLAEMLVAVANGGEALQRYWDEKPDRAEWEPVTEDELNRAALTQWLLGPEGRAWIRDEPTAVEPVDGALLSPMHLCPSATPAATTTTALSP